MTNLVTNPSFSSGLTGWTTTGSVAAVASDSGYQARTLPFCARIGTLLAGAIIRQTVVHQVGSLNQLTFYTNATNLLNTFTLTLGTTLTSVVIISATVSSAPPL